MREEVEGAVDRAFEILRARIDKFGVSSPTIQRLPGTDQISIELAGVSDAERVRKLLQSTAALEFWTVFTPQDVIPYFIEANTRLKEIQDLKNPKQETAEAVAKKDTARVTEDMGADSLRKIAEQMLVEAEKSASASLRPEKILSSMCFIPYRKCRP